jgi:hypothetical protein
MKKRDLQDEKLIAIERALLRCGKISDAEVEKIVAAPQLFERVQANIRTEESRRETKIKTVFAFTNFQFWNWQKSVLAFATVAILIFGAGAILMRFNVSPEQQQQATVKEQQFAVPSIKEQPVTASPQIRKMQQNDFQPHRIASTRKAESKSIRHELQKPVRAKKRLPQKFENRAEEPFIALTYAGNLANEESQIVRVEMTPQRLLSLGVRVQTENESEKIKTDLLVGAGGVAQAIRLVK